MAEDSGSPYFDLEQSKNVTAVLGKTALLNCRVKNIGNKTVSYATVSSTFKRVRFKLVIYKVHKNKVAQKCVLIVRSMSDRRADELNVWGNLISIHLEPNKSEHNAFEGRADSSIKFTIIGLSSVSRN